MLFSYNKPTNLAVRIPPTADLRMTIHHSIDLGFLMRLTARSFACHALLCFVSFTTLWLPGNAARAQAPDLLEVLLSSDWYFDSTNSPFRDIDHPAVLIRFF